MTLHLPTLSRMASTVQKAPRRKRCCVSLLNQLSTRLIYEALVVK